MTRMKRFTTWLQAKLVAAHARSYQDQAEPGTDLPHVTWSVAQVSENEAHRDDMTINVQIWDRNTDHGPIEEIAEAIEDALNRIKYRDGNMQVSVYKGSPARTSIPDPDPEVRRRELRFLAKVYFTTS